MISCKKCQKVEKSDMKNTIIIVALLLTSISLFSQKEEEAFYLFAEDSTWGVEIFHFPLGFAREIPYEGIEDARFPKGWSNPDSSTFWSYAFVWSINLNEELTEKMLEDNLKLYFSNVQKITSAFERLFLIDYFLEKNWV